jgi:hypothetical protein
MMMELHNHLNAQNRVEPEEVTAFIVMGFCENVVTEA